MNIIITKDKTFVIIAFIVSISFLFLFIYCVLFVIGKCILNLIFHMLPVFFKFLLKIFFSTYRSVYIIQGCRITLFTICFARSSSLCNCNSVHILNILYVWFCSYQYKISNYEGSSCRLSRI